MDSARKLGGESISSWWFNSPLPSQVVRLRCMMWTSALSCIPLITWGIHIIPPSSSSYSAPYAVIAQYIPCWNISHHSNGGRCDLYCESNWFSEPMRWWGVVCLVIGWLTSWSEVVLQSLNTLPSPYRLCTAVGKEVTKHLDVWMGFSWINKVTHKYLLGWGLYCLCSYWDHQDSYENSVQVERDCKCFPAW